MTVPEGIRRASMAGSVPLRVDIEAVAPTEVPAARREPKSEERKRPQDWATAK